MATVSVRSSWGNQQADALQRRKNRWSGTHVLRDAIERRSPFRVSEMQQGRAGLQVRRDAFGNGVVLGRLGCVVNLLLDGIPVRGLSIDEVVTAHEVAAIEAYNSLLNTPVELVPHSNRCGVFAVWTRECRVADVTLRKAVAGSSGLSSRVGKQTPVGASRLPALNILTTGIVTVSALRPARFIRLGTLRTLMTRHQCSVAEVPWPKSGDGSWRQPRRSLE